MAIKQPFDSAGLKWNPNFANEKKIRFSNAQKFIDSEVLRYCEPLTPKISGNLIRSGKEGTVCGSGRVKYTAPYAAAQYYNTAESRAYDPNRGAHWFERMKTAHKQAILEGAEKF